MKKIGDKITLVIPTDYGYARIEFTIIAILDNAKYGLLAQDRVVVGTDSGHGWNLSDSVDLQQLELKETNTAKYY